VNIIKTNELEDAINKGYHILTFAETGFAKLNDYSEKFGLDQETTIRFSEQVNNKDEPGSLHPKAPVSAVPRRFIRDMTDAQELATQIEYFLYANQTTIKATKLLFDFRAGVAPFVVDACELTLESQYANNIDEVIIINEN
jgi:hypothetical protein